MKSISVIVPVYNVENYIRECLDSILAQTVSSFELILIDDGSTDNSGRICDEYAQQDERIRVIHKENGGLSSARNKGLDEATGDYVCFIDSDDTLKPDFLEKLYDGILQHNSDLAFCDIDAKKLTDWSMEIGHIDEITFEEARRWLYDQYSREYVLMVIACDKLYAKELFDGLRFPLGRLHEDEFMIGPILKRANRISFVPEKLYVYRENTSGITSNANKFNIRHLDAIDAYTERIAEAIEDGDMEFAVATLKNALYKCARFYKEGKEQGFNEFAVAALKKYKEVFTRHGNLFRAKQRLKYWIFMVMPSAFISMFNP